MLRDIGYAARQAALLSVVGFPFVDAGGVMYEHLHPEWQYAHTVTCDAGNSLGPCGPSEWIQVSGSAACGLVGTQSPIDLILEDIPTEATNDANMTFHTNGTCCEGAFLTNEHTSEVKTADTCPYTFYVSRADGKEFHLHQMHFHSPSEHTFGGEYFPMEVHLVHVAADGQALVVAVPIAIGEPTGENGERADWLHKIIDMMPEIPPTATNEDGAEVEDPNFAEGESDFEDLDPYRYMVAGVDSFYHYVGSFTTPPCTTNTLWYMHTAPMVVRQATLDSYRATIQTSGPDNQLAPWGLIVQNQTADAIPPFAASAGASISWNASLGCNNRPVQALHGGAQETRTLMRATAFHVGELESCSVVAEEDGPGRHLYFIIAPIVLAAIGGCLGYFFCYRARAQKGTKRAVRGLKAKTEPKPAPLSSHEMAPLVVSPSVSSVVMPVAYVAQPQPQAIYYAAPEVQPQQVQYVVMPASAVQTYAAPASPMLSPAV